MTDQTPEQARVYHDWEGGDGDNKVPAFWSADAYLCTHTADVLDDLLDNLHGYPEGMTEESWRATLSEIIEGLRGYETAQNYSGQHPKEQAEVAYEAAQRSLRLIAEHLGSLWD